jgi:hypothetical protein
VIEETRSELEKPISTFLGWRIGLTPGGEQAAEWSGGWIWRRRTMEEAKLVEMLSFW